MTRRNVCAVPSRVPVESLRSQWVLARAVQRARPDVVFVPYHLSTPLLSGRVPVVSVVHDCVLERDAAARGHFGVLAGLPHRDPAGPQVRHRARGPLRGDP